MDTQTSTSSLSSYYPGMNGKMGGERIMDGGMRITSTKAPEYKSAGAAKSNRGRQESNRGRQESNRGRQKSNRGRTRDDRNRTRSRSQGQDYDDYDDYDDDDAEEPVSQDRDKISIGTKIAMYLLRLRNQLKIYHWQTNIYSEHTTIDNLIDKLTRKNDEWVEVFQGKYGRIRLEEGNASLRFNNFEESTTANYLEKRSLELLHLRDRHFAGTGDSDLSNIFDEIMGHLHRARYLLSLH